LINPDYMSSQLRVTPGQVALPVSGPSSLPALAAPCALIGVGILLDFRNNQPEEPPARSDRSSLRPCTSCLVQALPTRVNPPCSANLT